MTFASVDGCKAGWLVVSVDATAQIRSAVFCTPAELCEELATADVIAVDVPIGLTERGPRLCDQDARKVLRAPRASSVFSPPIRPVLGAATRVDASAAQKQIDGRGIGAQAWGICPKICEWDSYLREHRQIAKRIFEVHPEVSFWALNALRPMQFGKKSTDGRRERRELLVLEFGARALDETRSRHARRHVADDDLYDAFVALWTANRIHAGVAQCIPDSPPHDSQGMPMAIWY
jgi:predicted RNase H-like nuclease